MGIRAALLVLAAMTIGACGHEESNNARSSGTPAENQSREAETVQTFSGVGSNADDTDAVPSAQSQAQARPAISNELPLPGVGLRFVGLWASQAAECASSPWRFTAAELTTGKGRKCAIEKVAKVPGGYDLQASCESAGETRADLIRLRFAESARAMLLESKQIGEAGLVFCGQ